MRVRPAGTFLLSRPSLLVCHVSTVGDKERKLDIEIRHLVNPYRNETKQAELFELHSPLCSCILRRILPRVSVSPHQQLADGAICFLFFSFFCFPKQAGVSSRQDGRKKVYPARHCQTHIESGSLSANSKIWTSWSHWFSLSRAVGFGGHSTTERCTKNSNPLITFRIAEIAIRMGFQVRHTSCEAATVVNPTSTAGPSLSEVN